MRDKLADGVCNHALANPECCFDAGDCGCLTCNQKQFGHKINDGVCDKILNNADCCFDGGDCRHVASECASCPAHFVKFLRAHPEQCIPSLNIPLCCYSFGACEESNAVADCSTSAHRTVFSFLQFEMNPFVQQTMERGCPMAYHSRLGDGICDFDISLLEDICCFDGGDCLFEVQLACPSCKAYRYAFRALFDGACIPDLNSEECCYSLGNCPVFCDTCPQHQSHIGDGVCDNVLNHEACCFDGNDCDMQQACILNCPYDDQYLGDGICDEILRLVYKFPRVKLFSAFKKSPLS